MKYCIRRTVGEYGLQEGRSREENMACAKQWAEGGAFLHWWKPDRVCISFIKRHGSY
jgi:hypothetical protein